MANVIPIDSATSTKRIARIPEELTWIVQPGQQGLPGPCESHGYARNSHAICNSKPSRNQAQKTKCTAFYRKRKRVSATVGRPMLPIFRGMYCKTYVWCILQGWTCENEAFARDILQKLQPKLVKLSCKVSLCCETSLLWDLCCETSFLRILFCEFLFAMIFFCCETSLLRFFALRFVRCDFFKCETPCHRSITRFLNFLWSCEHIGRQSCRPHSAYPRNNGANLNTKAATCTTPSPHSCLCASWPH